MWAHIQAKSLQPFVTFAIFFLYHCHSWIVLNPPGDEPPPSASVGLLCPSHHVPHRSAFYGAAPVVLGTYSSRAGTHTALRVKPTKDHALENPGPQVCRLVPNQRREAPVWWCRGWSGDSSPKSLTKEFCQRWICSWVLMLQRRGLRRTQFLDLSFSLRETHVAQWFCFSQDTEYHLSKETEQFRKRSTGWRRKIFESA